MGTDFKNILSSIQPKVGGGITCPYCDATRPREGTQSCGCGATVFDKPQDPTPKGKDYRGARMSGAIFSNQDLRNADFTGARLSGAIFNGADLRGAKFDNARMSGAILTGARTEGASFVGARMSGMIR
jgi:hypothetical protein